MTFKMPSFLSGSDAGIERLTISSHKLRDCTDPPLSIFKVQANPEKLHYSFGYQGVGSSGNTIPSLGSPGGSGPIDGFTAYNKMGMKFSFPADATGLLPIEEHRKAEFMNGTSPSIRLHLNKLQHTVYGYEEEIHGPPYLKLVWGRVFPNSSTKSGEQNPAIYKASLKKCVVNITLFSLKGEPVKADILLELESQMAPEERPLGKSPDLTHAYAMAHGNKMTAYCQTIYGRYDSKICTAVAEYNNLIDWEIKGGTTIIFPSIHILEERYLRFYQDIEIQSFFDMTKKQRMIALIGEKKAAQFFKQFPEEQ